MEIDIQKFWSNINKTETCWLWIGRTKDRNSTYGAMSVKGREYPAHRLSYLVLKGDIPKGFVIDHLCRVPACVNPDHLEVVTIRENNLRGIAPSSDNARKTHCQHGHPLFGENLYIEPRGFRNCRECKRKWQREYGARRRTPGFIPRRNWKKLGGYQYQVISKEDAPGKEGMSTIQYVRPSQQVKVALNLHR